jgi:hypothetical protein
MVLVLRLGSKNPGNLRAKENRNKVSTKVLFINDVRGYIVFGRKIYGFI